VSAAPSLASKRLQSAKAQEAADSAAPVEITERPVAPGELPVQLHEHKPAGRGETILEIKNLTKVFKLRGALGKSTDFKAVDDVSFSVKRGSTMAIVGESGSGKSTVAQMALSLLPPTEGDILFDGVEVNSLRGKRLFDFRRRVQPIFQDPYGSLDPMFNIFRTIEEPLKIHKVGNAKSREKKVRELLDQVSMPASTMQRFPNELSGGQRQRIAVARALALNPDVIICDEAVSALDVLVQAQVLNLLNELQEDLGLTYLFITHDLAVVRQIADDVCVMQKGRLVERATTDEVFSNPQQQYTRDLLNAIPGASLLI
jgi:peptide/nickel transport system ATP-binding protein